MTALARPTCRPDMTCASVCLSQQRGTEQAEEKSPGLGLPCCRPPPRPRPPALAVGTDSFFIHMWQCASDAMKMFLCFQSFLRRHVLEHCILRILPNQTVRCLLKTKHQLLREQTCPPCSALRVTASPDSREWALGPTSSRGGTRGPATGGWTQGQTSAEDTGPLWEGLLGSAAIRRSLGQ